MEKRKGVTIHSNNESTYYVALLPHKFLHCYIGHGTYFPTNDEEFNLESVRHKICDQVVFSELKRVQKMALKYEVPLAKIQFIFSGPTHLGGTGNQPHQDLETGLRQEVPQSPFGRLVTRVFIQDVWDRDWDEYASWVQKGFSAPDAWEDES